VRSFLAVAPDHQLVEGDCHVAGIPDVQAGDLEQLWAANGRHADVLDAILSSVDEAPRPERSDVDLEEAAGRQPAGIDGTIERDARSAIGLNSTTTFTRPGQRILAIEVHRDRRLADRARSLCVGLDT